MNLLLNLHYGPCTLEELIKGTEPPTGAPEPQGGNVQAARAERWRAGGEGAEHTEPGCRGGSRGPWCRRPAPTLLCSWGQGDSVGAGRKGHVGRSGAPQSCRVLPLGCLERQIFRLEMAGQKPEAKSTATTHVVCRAMVNFGGEAHPNLREEQ